MDYYWELVQHDGTILEIPPEAVEAIKRRLDTGDPIHTKTMSIPTNQVKYFRQTERLVTAAPLLEAVAQAFNEPIEAENGSIKAKWVKKQVPSRMYSKHYAAIPAYRTLENEGHMVTIAFKLPIHLIDPRKLTECTVEEISRLTRK